jgi:hypothetical protein
MWRTSLSCTTQVLIVGISSIGDVTDTDIFTRRAVKVSNWRFEAPF